MHKNDPQKYIKNIRCPVLAITGEFDSQITPDENLKAIKSALKKGKNKKYTIMKMQGLNHMLQPVNSYQKYNEIDETLSVKLLDTIHLWLNSLRLQHRR